jgi:hypothetical protein
MGTSRPPRPNNVVALSHYRARLGRGRRLRRADALLEAPDLAAAVRALPGDELYYVLHEMGLVEGGEILAVATAEQLSVVLDFALWDRDQMSPAALAEWLEALAAAPVERIGRWLAGLDTELVGLILRRGARIIDLTQEAAPEEPEGIFYPTPDGFFLLDVRVVPVVQGNELGSEEGPDPARALIRLVDALYRTDKDFARRILVGATGELDAELEEAAYRWRQGRMSDLGFADYYEALEAYRPLDPASVKIGNGPGRTRTVVDAQPGDDGAALRMPTALVERLADTEGSPFARAAQKLAAGDEVDELRFALVTLTNRVLAADRIAPGDDEAVADVLERLVATLDLAVERLGQGDDARGADALRSVPLGRLFRLGVSLIGKVKQLALALRGEGPFGKRGFDLAESDDAVVLEAVTRLRPMFPRLLEARPAAGERPFRSLGDLARAAAAVEQAAAAQALARGLGIATQDLAPDGPALGGTGMDEAALDLGVLARTALVARLLAGGETKRAARPGRFQPLAPADVKAFEALLVGGKRKWPQLTPALEKGARAILAAAAPPALAAAAAAVADRWIAALAPLETVLVRAPEKPRRR